MEIAFISESHIGSHLLSGFKGDFISLQGSRGIIYTHKGFDLSPELKKIFSQYKTLIVGTDLDVVGTKIATVIKNFASSKGIETVRLALTEKGYMAGEFFSEKQMKALHELATLNKSYYKRYGYSLQSIVVLGRAFKDSQNLKSIKVVNNKGTSTITAIVKLANKGISVESGMKLLQHLYTKGVIEYPRVDNNYIKDKPFDLYPHPPLTAKLKKEKKRVPSFLQPFEEEELKVNRINYLIRLSNLRLITPASVVKYYKLLEEFFDENLKPYPYQIRKLKRFAKISNYHEEKLRDIFKTIFYPPKKLFPLPSNINLNLFKYKEKGKSNPNSYSLNK